jgi:hypothetical protein
VTSLDIDDGEVQGTGTINGTVNLNASAVLTPGTASTAGTFTTTALTLGFGTPTVNLNVGATSDRIDVAGLNGLTTNGAATLKISSLSGPLAVGTADLISHNGPIQGSGLAGFTLSGVGHAIASLQDTGSAVRLNVTQATQAMIWTGGTGIVWDNDPFNINWKFQSAGTATAFLDGDDVIFQDLAVPAFTDVFVASAVAPSRVIVNNTTANPFNVTGVGSQERLP